MHVSYLWDFGDGSDFAYEYEPTHTFPGPGEYYVSLVVEDEYGCISEATSIVHIYPNIFIYAPNIFTPNDDGDNDTFLVSAIGVDEFELIVFDRWEKKFSDHQIQIKDGMVHMQMVYLLNNLYILIK